MELAGFDRVTQLFFDVAQILLNVLCYIWYYN